MAAVYVTAAPRERGVDFARLQGRQPRSARGSSVGTTTRTQTAAATHLG